MGLDSYWRRPAADYHEVSVPTFDPPLKLCGGMFSGNGEGSFRGKVYNDLIEAHTGESLYQEIIPNRRVREMADKLASLPEETTPGSMYKERTAWSHTVEEIRDLKRMFRAYADCGYELGGWW